VRVCVCVCVCVCVSIWDALMHARTHACEKEFLVVE